MKGEPLSNPALYRSIVGALQYVTISRPEISYVVIRVCHFMHSPTVTHCALCYVKGTIYLGLTLQKAGWASDPIECMSQHSFAIYFGGNLISWSSRKQKVVAGSSTEAKYRAIAFAATELTRLQQLLQEMDVLIQQPPILLCNNPSATFLSTNPVFHQCSKAHQD
ncbi:hypothetical protein V2J09_020862 [Rumex salicifolius]